MTNSGFTGVPSGAVQLARRLDDPGHHQAADHLITASGHAKTQDVISTRQGIEQAAHPGGDDRQRAARRSNI
jgi:hypothetical protein